MANKQIYREGFDVVSQELLELVGQSSTVDSSNWAYSSDKHDKKKVQRWKSTLVPNKSEADKKDSDSAEQYDFKFQGLDAGGHISWIAHIFDGVNHTYYCKISLYPDYYDDNYTVGVFIQTEAGKFVKKADIKTKQTKMDYQKLLQQIPDSWREYVDQEGEQAKASYIEGSYSDVKGKLKDLFGIVPTRVVQFYISQIKDKRKTVR